MLNLTPLARLVLSRQVKNARSWRGDNIRHVQLRQLDMLTRKGERTGYGKANKLKHTADYAAFAATLPVAGYPEIRHLVMAMVDGVPDILWPGVCRRFAQSSGTSASRHRASISSADTAFAPKTRPRPPSYVPMPRLSRRPEIP